MKQQKRVSDELAEYGIRSYSLEQLEFHKDIMHIMKSEKHKYIGADDCLIVFGRIYSIYVASQLKKTGKILFK